MVCGAFEFCYVDATCRAMSVLAQDWLVAISGLYPGSLELCLGLLNIAKALKAGSH